VKYLLHDFNAVTKEIYKEENGQAKNLNALVIRCEHSRWNVEKPIMGFYPLQESDWYE